MLDSLHVKDLALIKETEIEFKPGLNILTGETGAGKSIVIGSVVLALGGKASKDMIRTGASGALVELIFSIDNTPEGDRIREKCQELGITPEDDTIVISRKLSQGKSLSRINGETVSLKAIKELSALLLDVCGQHEHQTLTDPKVQADILDSFCGDKLSGEKAKLKTEYSKYRELLSELSGAGADSGQRGKELDLAVFEVNEIEAAALKPGEDAELEEQFSLMENSKTILEGIERAHDYLGGDARSARDLIGLALRELKGVLSLDKELSQSADSLELMEEQLFDQLKFLSDHIRELSFEPGAFNEVSERLDVINRLKDRYGATIEDIHSYMEERRALIDKYNNYDAYLEELTARVDESKAKVLASCEKISALRRKGAKALEGEMIKALSDLSFAQVDFAIDIVSDPENPGYGGYDTITWMISVNPGQDRKPLAGIASGGELSRIMLGLKTVMAHNEDTSSLIFDEIDAGISGKTAWQISKKLGALSGEHQVICITHLPQIAAMADTHFLIEKREVDGSMGTCIKELSDEGSIGELSRLLGSDSASEAAIKNASELKDQAFREKDYERSKQGLPKNKKKNI